MDLLALDTALLMKIHALFSDPALDRVMVFITHLGDLGFLWLLLAAVLLSRAKTRRAGFCILLSMMICLLLGNGLIKNIVARPRPYTADPSIALLIPPSGEPFSFPSGHTMHAFAAACSVGLCGQKRLFWFALLFAFLIGFSRLYLMMHYPLDVLAGALLGFCAAYFAQKLLRRYERRRKVAR